MAENAHFQHNVRGFLETRHVLWWKGQSASTLTEKIADGMDSLGRKPPPSRSRSQAKCLALTPSCEGNHSGGKNNPKRLEIPQRTKGYTRGKLNGVTLLN